MWGILTQKIFSPAQKSCKYALNTVHSLVGMVDRHGYGKDIQEQVKILYLIKYFYFSVFHTNPFHLPVYCDCLHFYFFQEKFVLKIFLLKILARTTRAMKEMDEKGDQYFINTYKSKQYVFDLVRRVFNGSDMWRVSFNEDFVFNFLVILNEIFKFKSEN